MLSHLVMSDSLGGNECPTGSSVQGNSPVKNAGVGHHAYLQGIFPTQGLVPGLPHFKWTLYSLSHQGSLTISYTQTHTHTHTHSYTYTHTQRGRERERLTHWKRP